MGSSGTYVQFGCGFSTADGWLNFDSSPTLRVERLPAVGPTVSRLLARNSKPFPESVQYGDILRGLPVAENSVAACYASHVLEHLSANDMRVALRNTLKILRPGGVFRLIVPDLESRAKVYLKDLESGASDANSRFMRATGLGLESRPAGLLGQIRLMLGGSQHLWMWDEPSMRAELERAGFVAIRRCKFGDASEPMFGAVEEVSRFVEDGTHIEECAMEARKPD